VLFEVPRSAQVLLALLLSAAAAALGALAQGPRLVGLGTLAAGTALGAFAALVSTGLLLDPVIPLGVIGSHWALGLERIRRHFDQRLAQRELSLSTLLRVGEATVQAPDQSPLETALALLGDVVEASGVALFRVHPDGTLDDERLEWRRDDTCAVGDRELAGAVLASRRIRIFSGQRPGRRERGGAAVYTPLLAGQAPVGILVVERASSAPLVDLELRTIAIVGTQLALSAQNARLLADLRQTFDASVESVASAIEARDGYTEMHCRRLAAFSVMMAGRLGLPAAQIEAIRLGALLHDVGKIGIRDDVLLKPGRFTPQERIEMQRHPEIGRRIVRSIPGISETTVHCILHHHEWWDGRGYPAGLAGHAIPLAARIVGVVDVWDALSTSRPYKVAYPQETVRMLLRKASGAQFEPELVELLLRVLDEEGDEVLALLSAPSPAGREEQA
jgi:HD-GYP domain-containing protein (c-di-GMP phosphodiesterase class II)